MALLLSAQNLAKSYSHRPLFKNITMGLYDGEKTGLFGPNGSGKSTFLKILANREQPDSGSLEARRGINVGYLPQTDAFSAETPHDEVLNALLKSGTEEIEAHTQTNIILTKIGFVEDTDHDPLRAIASLSGGWRKRLALAR